MSNPETTGTLSVYSYCRTYVREEFRHPGVAKILIQLRPTVSDYVRPFCSLGRASLRAYLDDTEDPPAIEWRSFDLRGYERGPDGEFREAVDDGTDDASFQQVRENVARLRERYDVEMRSLDALPEVDSWIAQLATLHARREHDPDTTRAFHDAVFGALWTDGRDIGDPDVRAEIAGSVGLTGDEVRAALRDEELEATLREHFAAARERGVTGVPTSVYGEHAARGAVPPEQLRRLNG